jgi:flagellar basal body P-ring formation protein FlgA
MILRSFMLAAALMGNVAQAGDVTAADAARVALQRALRAAWPDAVRIEVNAVGKNVGSAVAVAGTQWIAVVPDVSAAPRRVTVPVKLVRGTRQENILPVAFSVSLYRPVLCAARPLRPGMEVVGADFAMREKDVAGAKPPLDAAAEVAGMRARHFVPEGAVVSAADLAPAPAVIKGREVAVLVAAPTVQIEARGIAEEDGERGRMIRVRSKNSDATYLAEVVDQGRVRVAGR